MPTRAEVDWREENTSGDGVALRSVEDSDLDALFDQMRDPESVGFTIIGTEISYASARNAEIEETVLRLG